MGTMFYKDEPYGGGSKGNYLPTTGGTMTGQIKTSFKSSIAMGSYQAEATTIPDLINEVRYSSGCCGSANITTPYSGSPASVLAGWYNFLYIPHRSGGVNGAASGDNCDYGRLELFGMAVDGEYEIRFGNGNIVSCKKVAFVSELAGVIKLQTAYSSSQTVAANAVGTFDIDAPTVTGYTLLTSIYSAPSSYTVTGIIPENIIGLEVSGAKRRWVVRNVTSASKTLGIGVVFVYVKNAFA